MKKFFRQYPLVLLSALFLFGFAAADLLVPIRIESEMENRYLQTRPRFTLRSLFEEGERSFTHKYETYVNDQFVLRDQWISLKSRAEYALGKTENNGILYGEDHYLFEKYIKADWEGIEKNIQFVNEFLEMYPELPVTVSILPNSYTVLSKKLLDGLYQVDQTAAIQEITEKIQGEKVRIVSFEPVLREHEEEYIYYRTDHHWTTYGAYLAYREYVEALGLKAVELSQLEGKEVPDFYGTYYSKAKLFNAVADVITYYDIHPTQVTIDGKESDGIYEEEKFLVRDKYAAFLKGNHGVTVIKSENNLNHREGETSRILLIKDSYGNCFAPFLTYSFDEVYVVDLRSIPIKMKDLLGETSFDQVLLLYNFMNFSTDTNLAKLRY